MPASVRVLEGVAIPEPPTRPGEIDAVVLRMAETVFGCRNARLVWVSGTNAEGQLRRHQWPTTPLTQEEARLIDAALARRASVAGGVVGNGWVRMAHSLDYARAVFLADWPEACALPGGTPAGLVDFLTLLSARMRAEIELVAAHNATGRIGKAAQLQTALYSIADLASSELDMREMLRRTHAVVAGLMYAENFLIALHEPERDTVRFVYDADENGTNGFTVGEEVPAARLRNSLTLAVIRSGLPAMGPSHQLREQFGLEPAGEFGPGSADWLGVPMVSEGVVRGALVVQSYNRRGRYTEADRAQLGFVAQHILIALQRKQVQMELEHRVEDRTRALTEEVLERQRGEKLQSALYSIADLASSDLDMAEMLRRIHLVVAELMYARNLIIALYDIERETLRVIYHADEKDPGIIDTGVDIPEAQMRDTMTLGVIRSGRAVMGPPVQVVRQLGIPEGVYFGAIAEDVLGVPMVSEGTVRGAVLVQSYDAAERYGEEDRALLAYVAQHILTALDRKQAQAELENRVTDRTRELAKVVGALREQIGERERAEQQLMHETMHDSLTGLPNRSFLYEALERAIARMQRNPDHRFAVLFLDLDRFKVVNDSVGHLAGDEMLKQAGARLAGCVRPFDVVARLGGDEFAVLLEDVNLPEEACHVAQRAIESLSEPMHISGKELFTSASVGIALGHSRYRRAEELLRDADVAMYRAKAHGRQRFEIFDERLHREALQLLELENDLRRAIQRYEFEPHFQPIVRLSDLHVVGYEALLRWRHPQRGLVPPGEFLEVAEENGSVEQIDWQLFERACREIGLLGEDSGYVTLNVSPRHFRSPTLAEQMLDLFDTYQLSHDRIRLEVTEGALLDNPEQVRVTLEALRNSGIVAALDDFGTGYSSLSYLHRFPLHSIKIDRSFVSALQRGERGGSAAVVRAVLAMARTLGMDVIAEGVETDEQRDYLLEMGCELGQGFLFSRARPASEWAAQLRH
ncbi:bifunctional diguanylate cyclase/phosphodiesterase [Lysobacter solisilvae (ex Woo and Kim 2020)]|uniref:EAL domain-containing protein n=1 Tax=Agrilutibacter terrestris TaxID=2865112 RepID=A0A7H0FW55_9GAMM|nr:GGDEF domain-containing protein [Lysobacter terrestris]QNP40271.1 EAL domain-containing protein [Lysobacter terrestris]